MRADDLTLDTLFDADPKGGVIRFAGERAVLLDTAALGLLRKELIDTLSLSVARGVLYRFGWAHGFRTAEAMKGGVRLGQPGGVDQGGRPPPPPAGRRHVPPRPARAGGAAAALRAGDLGGVVRGRAAPPPLRPLGRAGLLDADRLRERLPDRLPRAVDPRRRGDVRRKGRRRAAAWRASRRRRGTRRRADPSPTSRSAASRGTSPACATPSARPRRGSRRGEAS